jgi:hypothetical protein
MGMAHPIRNHSFLAISVLSAKAKHISYRRKVGAGGTGFLMDDGVKATRGQEFMDRDRTIAKPHCHCGSGAFA